MACLHRLRHKKCLHEGAPKTHLPITPRECDVVKLLAEGLLSKQIGDRLGISKTTVDKHRQNILRRTQTNTTAELVTLAIKEGWI